MSNTETANRKKTKKQKLVSNINTMEGGGGGWVLQRIIGGGCRRVLHILTLFQTKTCHFPHPFYDVTSKIHTSFQTWRQSQNATYMITKTEIRSSLLRWERQQKNIYIFLKIYLEFAHYGFMLFTGWEVRIVRNCARGLEYRPRP